MEIDKQIEKLRRCELIKESEVRILCKKAKEILIEESNVQRVFSPVTVRKNRPLNFLVASHTHTLSLPLVLRIPMSI